MLPCLHQILTHEYKKGIFKEACWIISNITAGDRVQIQIGKVQICVFLTIWDCFHLHNGETPFYFVSNALLLSWFLLEVHTKFNCKLQYKVFAEKCWCKFHILKISRPTCGVNICECDWRVKKLICFSFEFKEAECDSHY